MRTDDHRGPGHDSLWWYVIAAVPLFYVVTILVVALVFGFGFPDEVSWLGEIGPGLLVTALVVPGFLLTLALPYPLYRDITLLTERNVDPQWRPDRSLYTIAAAVGIFIPGVSFVVSVYYLYERHVHVGTL